MRIAVRCSLFAVIAAAGCSSNSSSTPVAPVSVLPGPSSAIAVPAGVSAASGYRVSVFAASPSGSTNPDSIVEDANSIFIGYGDNVGPDGSPGPTGKTSTEVVQYDLTGKLLKTYTVVGHNDGLMAYDANTIWAMSNEDANPKLTIINIASGTTQLYSAQPSLLGGANNALPTGGGIDDMQRMNGVVYVSASNPTTATGACPASTSTPGCPNGVSTVPFVYMLTLNGDGSTFNLTPVASSNTVATNAVTGASATLNATDPDSESLSPDGSTLIVDSQQDADLVLIKNPGSAQSVSFVPLVSGGAPQQVDDTRFAPQPSTFLLLADTPSNLIYRIDATFATGSAFSAGQTALMQTNLTTGVLTPVVSGLGAPHGLWFVTAQ